VLKLVLLLVLFLGSLGSTSVVAQEEDDIDQWGTGEEAEAVYEEPGDDQADWDQGANDEWPSNDDAGPASEDPTHQQADRSEGIDDEWQAGEDAEPVSEEPVDEQGEGSQDGGDEWRAVDESEAMPEASDAGQSESAWGGGNDGAADSSQADEAAADPVPEQETSAADEAEADAAIDTRDVVENGKVVSVHYTLTERTADGPVVETTNGKQPLAFIYGKGMMFAAFEERLEGLRTGENFSFVIPAASAYGEYDSSLVTEVPKKQFEVDGKIHNEFLEVGKVYPLRDAQGNIFQVTVVSIGPDTVKIDPNHPMAGVDLYFTGHVEQVRNADPQELARDQVQGEGGSGR
jgi:FKBP-type peptidyl-prolyl cis-trans isomerase SlyD